MKFPTVFKRYVGVAPAGGIALGADSTPTSSANRNKDNCLSVRVAPGPTPTNRLVIGYRGPETVLTCNVYQWDDSTEAWYLISTGQLTNGSVKRFLLVAMPSSTAGHASSVESCVVVAASGGEADGTYTFGVGADSSVTPEQQTAVTGGAVDQGAAGMDPWLVVPAGPVTIAQPVSVTASGGTLAVQDAAAETSLASIDGKLSSALPLPTGAASEATLAAVSAKLTAPLAVVDSNVELAAAAIAVQQTDGSQKTQVTNFPSTQPVSGPLTDTQLRATAVPVSGPLTDTQLRASAVPVSAAALPLAAGAATAVRQDTGNASLASIDGKLSSLGQKSAAQSVPVVLSSDKSFPFDAFGRVRVSNPKSLFVGKQLDDASPFLFTTFTATGGTATFVPLRACTNLVCTSASGSRALRQTKRYINYQPGKSQQIFITFGRGSQVANVEKDAGFYDDNDGIMFRVTGSALSLVLRSSTSGGPVENVVAQSAWNQDKLDGTGVSGITLDPSKIQIFLVDFEWLGAGIVRTGFVIDGVIYWAHWFKAANLLALVYMRTPRLPVRWEVKSLSASAGADLDAICCSVTSEGGSDPTGLYFYESRGGTALTIGASAVRALMSIRLKADHNRASVFPSLISILALNNADTRWFLMVNPTFTGGAAASWTDRGTGYAVEFDIARDGTLNEDGLKIVGGYFSGQGREATLGVNTLYALASDYLGTTRDELVLGVQNLTGGAKDYYGGMQWLVEA